MIAVLGAEVVTAGGRPSALDVGADSSLPVEPDPACDRADVRPLPFGLTEEALAAAMAEPDPDSLAAATRLRERSAPSWPPRRCTRSVLRRRPRQVRGRTRRRCSSPATGSSRPAGPRSPTTTPRGCWPPAYAGWSTSAVASAPTRWPSPAPGWRWSRWTRDPETAAVAAANLGRPGRRCCCADAEERGGRAARRRARRRSATRPGGPSAAARGGSRTSPRLVASSAGCWTAAATAGVKLGPGLPHDLIPADVEAEWLTARRHRRGRSVGRARGGTGRAGRPWSAPRPTGIDWFADADQPGRCRSASSAAICTSRWAR